MFINFVSQKRFTPYYKTAGGERVPITRLPASNLVLGYKVKADKYWGEVIDFMRESEDLLPQEPTPAKAAKIAAANPPPVLSDSDDSSLEPEKIGVLNLAACLAAMVDLPPGFKVFDSDSSDASPLTPLSPEMTKQAGGGDIEAVTEKAAELSISEVDLDLSTFAIIAKDPEPSVDI